MNFPVLQTLATQSENCGEVRSVLLTHVLHTAVDFVLTVHRVFPVHTVIAVPYSVDNAAVSKLRGASIRVIQPRSVDEVSQAAVATIMEALRASSVPLVVQEVGGYLAGHSAELGQYDHFLGVVEDTNNGHWNYEHREPHNIPILSVARSPLKDIEDTLIGDAVAYSLERIFREEFGRILQGTSVGILGYGKIGTSTAIAMRGRESSVHIHDTDPVRNIRARFEGFHVASLEHLLARSDVVIGCTGRQSVRADDIQHLRNGAVLVSASSKQIEFDLPGFAASSLVVEEDDLITRYGLPNGRHFYVLRRGTPVNFRDSSILGPVLDLIYSELFLAIQQLAIRQHRKGLSQTGPEIHRTVALTWWQVYG